MLRAELGAINALAWQLDPDFLQAAEVGSHLLRCSASTATLRVSSYQACITADGPGCAGVITSSDSVWLPVLTDWRKLAGLGPSLQLLAFGCKTHIGCLSCWCHARPCSLLKFQERG